MRRVTNKDNVLLLLGDPEGVDLAMPAAELVETAPTGEVEDEEDNVGVVVLGGIHDGVGAGPLVVLCFHLEELAVIRLQMGLSAWMRQMLRMRYGRGGG